MINGRVQKLKANATASLIFQVVTIICGFITPKLLLSFYGSEINGLVASITQFLSLISFLELGVGAVVQSSLYKPLSQNDTNKISQIMASATRFFRKLAWILLCYIIVLVVGYPLVVKSSFDFCFTATLIISMSISSFAQYYFGVAERLLLTADQRGYIQYNAQTATLVANTLACIGLIVCGAPIQVVKLTTSGIYLIRPIILHIYVDKKYHLERHATYQEEPITQKWNGVAQHIASVVLDGTDSIVLTLFASLSDVSIYSVYHLVVYGVKTLFLSLTNGVQALLGEMWAKQESDALDNLFEWIEWILHTGTILIFGCTATLSVSFVAIYTKGINDANYSVPVFALLITLANACHCLRLPYNLMILAAGHYRQTQANYVTAAGLNILVSIATVKMLGLVGVAIGTLSAMLYQTIWMALYDSKNFHCCSFKRFLKQCAVDTFVFAVAYGMSCRIVSAPENYLLWVCNAVCVFAIWALVEYAINRIIYPGKVGKLKNSVYSKIKRLLKMT